MQTYLYMNLLIAAGFASMRLLALFFKVFRNRTSHRIVLNTNYALMGACLTIPFCVLAMPVESVTIAKNFVPDISVTHISQPLTDLMTDLTTLKQANTMIPRHGSWLELFMVSFILASLYQLSRFVRGRRDLKRLYQSGHKIRLIRGIEFRVSDAVSVPLATHRQRYSVILPEWMLTDLSHSA